MGSLHHTIVEDLRQILGRTLVLVAHSDDEAVGCGALLQRMADPIVVFATDSAPRSDYFWKQYGSRQAYASLRKREAAQALNAVGVTHFHFVNEENLVVDQEVFLNLNRVFESLSKLIETELPEAILSLAYEGGHPDHDSCAFLASIAGRRFELPVWEMPLYHFAHNEVMRSAFIDGASIQVSPISDELQRKHAMFSAYASQAHVLAEFSPEAETVRPMFAYDFSRAPHSGTLNYEAWQWPMKGSDLCEAFTSFLNQSSNPTRKREWGTAA